MGLYSNIVSFIFVFIILIACYFCLKNNKVKNYIAITIIFFIIFFSYTKFLEKKYDNSFINCDKTENFIIKIVSDKETGNYYNKYVGKVKNRENKNLKILIYIKDTELKYGDILKIYGEVTKPNKARNKNGFDYERYLREKKISGIVQVEKLQKIAVQKDFFYYLYRIKEICLERTSKMYNEKELGFINAILFGKISELDEEIREDFKLSNLSHVLAISGMHVSYIVLGLEKFLKIFIKNIKLRNVVIIIFLILFIPFVGGSASVARACMMTIIAYIAKTILEKDDFYSSFCLSLFILLAINPYNINSVSMWLSFGGSIGIVVFNNFLNKVIIRKIKGVKLFKESSQYFESSSQMQRKLVNFIRKISIKIIEISLVSLSAQIIIFPIMLYYFNTISLTFFISNVLISELVGPILILGYLSVIFYWVGVFFSYIEKFFIKLAFLVAEFCSKLFLNQIFLPTPKLYILIIYYVSICYLVYKFSNNKYFYLRRILNKKYVINFINRNIMKLKKIFIAIILFVFLINVFKYVPKNLRINFLDVGQGDCTLLRTSRNNVVLIDSGEGNSDKYDYGKNVVFPYLLDEGIMKIHYMIISHFDSDHVRWYVLYFRKYESRKYSYRNASRRI